MSTAWVVYRVSAGSEAVRGHMTVSVHPRAVERWGERQAIASACWQTLADMQVRKRYIRDIEMVFQGPPFEVFSRSISYHKTGLEWRE